jgi:hypothetical protein
MQTLAVQEIEHLPVTDTEIVYGHQVCLGIALLIISKKMRTDISASTCDQNHSQLPLF